MSTSDIGQAANQGINAFIDSIEEGIARLTIQQAGAELTTFTLPTSLLPAEAKEGDWVEIQIKLIATPEEEDPAALRRRLGAKDDGQDFSL